jgi:hypothetical protein
VIHYEWLLSGSNLQLHAFPAEDEYAEPEEVESSFRLRDRTGIEYSACVPHAAYMAVCRHIVPVAMLLSAGQDAPRCGQCVVFTTRTVMPQRVMSSRRPQDFPSECSV